MTTDLRTGIFDIAIHTPTPAADAERRVTSEADWDVGKRAMEDS